LLFGSVQECSMCDPSFVRPDKGTTRGPHIRYPRMACPGCGKDSAYEDRPYDRKVFFSHAMPNGVPCTLALHPDDARLREWYELEMLMGQ